VEEQKAEEVSSIMIAALHDVDLLSLALAGYPIN
jgi:hypothetical protein